MWDNLTCWPSTPRGQVVVLSCPLIFQLFSSIHGKSPGLKAQSQAVCCEWGQRGGFAATNGIERTRGI